jgi:hypothetical protein
MTEKTYNTKQDPEADFSFKLKQNPYNYGGHRPPSFDWKLKMGSWLTSTLEMQNEIGKCQGAPSTLGSYI